MTFPFWPARTLAEDTAPSDRGEWALELLGEMIGSDEVAVPEDVESRYKRSADEADGEWAIDALEDIFESGVAVPETFEITYENKIKRTAHEEVTI